MGKLLQLALHPLEFKAALQLYVLDKPYTFSYKFYTNP